MAFHASSNQGGTRVNCAQNDAPAIFDALAIALLALRANNVLSWPTSIVLVVVTIIIGIILKRRIKS